MLGPCKLRREKVTLENQSCRASPPFTQERIAQQAEQYVSQFSLCRGSSSPVQNALQRHCTALMAEAYSTMERLIVLGAPFRGLYISQCISEKNREIGSLNNEILTIICCVRFEGSADGSVFRREIEHQVHSIMKRLGIILNVRFRGFYRSQCVSGRSCETEILNQAEAAEFRVRTSKYVFLLGECLVRFEENVTIRRLGNYCKCHLKRPLQSSAYITGREKKTLTIQSWNCWEVLCVCVSLDEDSLARGIPRLSRGEIEKADRSRCKRLIFFINAHFQSGPRN